MHEMKKQFRIPFMFLLYVPKHYYLSFSGFPFCSTYKGAVYDLPLRKEEIK